MFKRLRDGLHGEWGKIVPVIFITGYGNDVIEKIDGIKPEPVFILRKPLNIEDLLLKMLENFEQFQSDVQKTPMGNSDVYVTINNIMENIGNPVTTLDIDIDIDINVVLPKIQKDFHNLKKDLLGVDEDFDKDLLEINDELLGLNANSDKKDLIKPFNKLYLFIDSLNDEESKFNKIIKGTKKGCQLINNLITKYNDISTKLGLPSLTSFFQ